MSQEDIVVIDDEGMSPLSGWTSADVVALFDGGYTGSILVDDGDAWNYTIFTLVAFSFFMGLHYFWWLVFEKCWRIERYHDAE